jgi:Caudovirus prohead serine protease
MNVLCQIRGYANVFDQFSGELDGDEPLRERIRPGAFRLLHFPVMANVAHCSAPIASQWDRSLRLWMDSHGLAFEADIRRRRRAAARARRLSLAPRQFGLFGAIEIGACHPCVERRAFVGRGLAPVLTQWRLKVRVRLEDKPFRRAHHPVNDRAFEKLAGQPDDVPAEAMEPCAIV